MATLIELITRVQVELGEANGPDVQLYGQPRVAAVLQREFNNVFDMRFWYDLTNNYTLTLDGTTGLVTTNQSAVIKRWKDIQYVWIDGNKTPLPQLPVNVNPNMINQPCIERYGTAVNGCFRVRPLTQTGTIIVRARTKPADFTEDTEVPFDDDYLVLKACEHFLVGEGTNLKWAEKYKRDADDALKALISDETSPEKSFYDMTASYIDQWQTV